MLNYVPSCLSDDHSVNISLSSLKPAERNFAINPDNFYPIFQFLQYSFCYTKYFTKHWGLNETMADNFLRGYNHGGNKHFKA